MNMNTNNNEKKTMNDNERRISMNMIWKNKKNWLNELGFKVALGCAAVIVLATMKLAAIGGAVIMGLVLILWKKYTDMKKVYEEAERNLSEKQEKIDQLGLTNDELVKLVSSLREENARLRNREKSAFGWFFK